MTTPSLSKTIPLANGQSLEILDASRKVAGDAWLVKIIFRMEVAVNDLTFSETGTKKIKPSEIKAALGPSVVLEVIRERNFIHETVKDATAENLVNDYLRHILDYISKADFPEKFVIRKFMEFITAQELRLKAEA